ncbi:hypothetical protein GWK16_03915 [Roseomonas sp. JC162]|uniref:Uncharacterized protein n=1 Tax=Neoroseomonas marina TaxID=1232220 RepID=A0A848EA78_9PROT|nr:hypothetical protein [Neoroseomonas marina]NMJ40373.1 hypothetical protein [Neoroseomonas marina]
MIARIAALAFLALPGIAAAQTMMPCDQVEATSRPGMMGTRGYAMSIEDGTVRRILLMLENGQRSITELMPMGNGVSVRLITFSDPRDASRVTAVFNRAVVEPAGTVLVETWVRQPDADQPAHNFYRVRCNAGALPRK